MARVLVATQPWGVLWEKQGDRTLKVPTAGQLASIATTVYTASTGGTTISAPAFISDDLGQLPGYVEEGGPYLFDRGDDVPVEVHAVSGGVPGRVADLEDGSAWTGATAGDVLTYGTPPVWAPLSASVGEAAPLNVQWPEYGAVGDGIADDTAEIQAAITAANAMAAANGDQTIVRVLLPPGDYRAIGLTNPGQVHIFSEGARLRANGSGQLIAVTGNNGYVTDLALHGGGSGAGVTAGVRFVAGTYWGKAEGLRFDQFAGRAIWSQGIADVLRDIIAMNCLLDTASLSAKTGVVEIDGSDCLAAVIEATASRSSLSSASRYACAIAIVGGTHLVKQLVGEISDVGIYVNCVYLQAELCRADLNYGHGWEIAGGTGQLGDCKGLRNSRAATNTYSGLYATAGSFRVNNFLSESLPADGFVHKYGIEDTQGSDAIKNYYHFPASTGHGTAAMVTHATAGAGVTLPDHPQVAVSGATPSADGLTQLRFANGGATTVTAITKGVNGQPLLVYGDGVTTIQHNAAANGFVLTGGANVLLGFNVPMTFRNYNGIWYQV